jgi:hypothetical protein
MADFNNDIHCNLYVTQIQPKKKDAVEWYLLLYIYITTVKYIHG